MSRRSSLVWWALLAGVLYVGAFTLLSVGGAFRRGWVVWVAVALLVAAAILLQLTLSRARKQGLLSRPVRLWVAIGIMVLGAVLGLVWWFAKLSGGWGLCSLCALYLGAGQVLAEIRSRTGGAPRRGALWIAGCVVLFAVGLIGCFAVSVWWLAASGFALLVAPVGLSLLSEDVLRAPPPAIRLGWVAGPVLVVAGALLLGSLTELPGSLTWPIAMVLGVLVGAIASNTQADVLLVVTVIAVVWAANPRPVEPNATITPTPTQPTLVSLGDSYMSGEGAQKFFDGTNESTVNECRRAPTAYAPLVAKSEALRLAFYACSGAKAKHIHRRAQFPGEPIDLTPDAGTDQLDQLRSRLEASGDKVRLVIVSIGGNDAEFATIAAACLAPGTCVERGQLWLDRLKEVSQNISRAYEQIRSVVGEDVPVLAVPYPVPVADHACSYSLLTRDEHRFLQGFVQELNGAVQQAVRDAGFYYLGAMAGAFSNKLRICDAPQDEIGVNFIALRSVNGVVDQVVNPANWIHNSVHPNERGHAAMAKVVEEWMRTHPNPPAKPDPRDEVQAFTPASLEQLMGAEDIAYCGSDPEPGYCGRDDTAWALTQVAHALRDASVPALLLVLGWWLLWLPLLSLTRPRWKKLGDRVGRELTGV